MEASAGRPVRTYGEPGPRDVRRARGKGPGEGRRVVDSNPCRWVLVSRGTCVLHVEYWHHPRTHMHSHSRTHTLFLNLTRMHDHTRTNIHPETETFCSVVQIPELAFPGAVDIQETDEPTVRIYPAFGGMILWNRAYTIDHSHTYDLQNFPFDFHALPIRLSQNSSRTWDLFDVTVCNVQFHRDALSSAYVKLTVKYVLNIS